MKLTTTIDGREITRNVTLWNGVFKTLPVGKKFHVWAAPCLNCQQIHRSPILGPIGNNDMVVYIEKNNDCYQNIPGLVGLVEYPGLTHIYIELNNCRCPEDHPHNERGCYMGLCSCRVGT